MKTAIKNIIIFSSISVLFFTSALHAEKVTLDTKSSPETQGWEIVGGLPLKTGKFDGKKVFLLEDQSTEDSIALKYTLPSEISEKAMDNGYKLSVSMYLEEDDDFSGPGMSLIINLGGERLSFTLVNNGISQSLRSYDKELKSYTTADVSSQELTTWEIIYKPDVGVEIFNEGESLVPAITPNTSYNFLENIIIGGSGGGSKERTEKLHIEKLTFETLK